MGCTIDPGPDLEPPMNSCNASSALFVQPDGVWDDFFVHYDCGRSSCHDSKSGHGFFRLADVSAVPRPAPGTPLGAWPTEWGANLMNIERFLSCSNPAGSDLITFPENLSGEHPGGTIIGASDRASAEAIFEDWLK